MLKQMKRRRMMKKIILTAVMLVTVLAAGIMVLKLILRKTVEVSHPETLPFLEREISEAEADQFYYYSLLGDDEQKAYREIFAGIEEGRNEIYVHLEDPDRGNVVYQYVYMDHPEFFWCDGSSKTTSYTAPEAYSVIVPGYTCTGEERERRRQETEAAVQAWLLGIPQELSEYEKIKSVYEQIINTVDYRADAPDNQNIYSVFVGRESVCAGYARATQYLLNRLGIFCTYVTGTVYTGEAHAWNLVKCDGEYYYVDTTWGDPVFLQEESGEALEEIVPREEINYDYLCCSDEEFQKTHTLSGDVSYPPCTADTYEYYKMNGMYYEGADADVLETVLQRSIEEKEEKVVMKFSNEEVYQAAYDILFGGLLEKQAQYLGRWYGLNQIHYYYREEARANKITIYWMYE